jgi:acetyl-CoA carboxylase biotin carboxyl carrier protein
MAEKKKSSGSLVSNGTALDVEALRQIVEMVEGSEISRLEWQKGDERLVIRRGRVVSSGRAALVSIAPTAAPVLTASEAPRPSMARPNLIAPPNEKKGHVITSPFVGTFYRTPAPDQPPFVEVGSQVKKGQVLCIIEAMKLMNEIESEVAGKVAEVLVENAQPVEFGQALFRIEP